MPEWLCVVCETLVRFEPGREPDGDLPERWVRGPDGETCSRCATLTAIANAKARGLDARRVGEAAAEHELRADPTGDPGRIASRLRAHLGRRAPSVTRISEIARELVAAGEIPALRSPGAVKPRRSVAEREAVERELREDPRRVNLQIATAAGIGGGEHGKRSYVKRTRERLEVAGEIERFRAPGRKPRKAAA